MIALLLQNDVLRILVNNNENFSKYCSKEKYFKIQKSAQILVTDESDAIRT
jgi:hypothetical protein